MLDGKAPDSLLDSYAFEREMAADENILQSSRSTDFITPKSEISRIFRDAVLDLSEHYAFARPLVNSGRLSVPCIYDGSPLNGPDTDGLPARTRPGSPVVDAPLAEGWLLDQVGGDFLLLGIGAKVPDQSEIEGIQLKGLNIPADRISRDLRHRYLDEADAAVYLIRPDQHVAARWTGYDAAGIKAALKVVLGKKEQAT